MRIASLSPAVTEILFKFELNEHAHQERCGAPQIICTDKFSDYPEEAQHIPHLSDHQDVDIQELMSYEPELVLTSTVIQEKLSERLRSMDISVVHQDPRTISAIYESIRNLGVLFQCESKAEELILQMQQGFNDTKKKAGLLPQRLRLYIEEWPHPPMVSGNWVPEIMRIAGGEQFPIQVGELSREVHIDAVQDFDPHMIVLSWCGAGTTPDPNVLREREGWSDLRAVQEENIRVIDDSLLNRPGPRLVEGAQRLYGWMFELLH